MNLRIDESCDHNSREQRRDQHSRNYWRVASIRRFDWVTSVESERDLKVQQRGDCQGQREEKKSHCDAIAPVCDENRAKDQPKAKRNNIPHP